MDRDQCLPPPQPALARSFSGYPADQGCGGTRGLRLGVRGLLDGAARGCRQRQLGGIRVGRRSRLLPAHRPGRLASVGDRRRARGPFRRPKFHPRQARHLDCDAVEHRPAPARTRRSLAGGDRHRRHAAGPPPPRRGPLCALPDDSRPRTPVQDQQDPAVPRSRRLQRVPEGNATGADVVPPVKQESLRADDRMPTVCFVARRDFESMPGGDTMQWRMYERVAREAGLRPITWFDDSSMPPADVYHAFNIDRPLELYPKLAEVKRRGRPFILSTIHHPHEWITKYYTFHPPGGALGSLLFRSALGRSMPARETIREIVTVARDRRIARILALAPSWRRRVQWLLRNADRIMLLTGSEATYVQTDFAYEIPRHQQVII